MDSTHRSSDGDTSGESPEVNDWRSTHLDCGHRYTTRTTQAQRSFEDTSLK